MVKFLTTFKENSSFLEISDYDNNINEYLVEFVDLNTNIIEYSTILHSNHWSQLDNTLYKNILIRVSCNGNVVFERSQNDKFGRVYILFGSKSIGDTIAWIPYVEEYRKINNVEVIVFTAHNYLFDNVYSDIIFTDNSNILDFVDVDKRFRIDYGPELYKSNGVSSPEQWYNESKKFNNCVEYFDYRKESLQSVASLILGLPNNEIVPKVNIPKDSCSKIKGKYVVVAIQSTSQMKYWNNPFGWESLFDFLGRSGYKIVIIDKYKSYGVPGYFNKAPKSKYVIDKTGDFSLLERIVDIKYADMMITISSGLSWLSWAVGTPVVMVSGFTKPFNEFKSNNYRVHNNTVCNGCWNENNITFDSSDWLFCPKKNDFVCSKVIQAKDVIEEVKKVIKKATN